MPVAPRQTGFEGDPWAELFSLYRTKSPRTEVWIAAERGQYDDSAAHVGYRSARWHPKHSPIHLLAIS